MLFEEYFKKKKISLEALQQGDPGLFSEFKEHFEQMGEKSFDHTKKYWFNKLRHVYPLPPEVKAEKIRPENQMAEQTITNTLTEPGPRESAANNVGFKPRFKAVTVATDKPIEKRTEQVPAEKEPEGNIPEQPTAKPAYKPRFTPKTVTTKAEDTRPTEPTAATEDKPVETASPSAENAEQKPESAPKMGFKPRFKAGVTNKPATTATNETATSGTAETTAEAAPTTEKVSRPSESGTSPEENQQPIASDNTTPPAATPKIGFTPRFKAGVTNKPTTNEGKPAATEPAATPQESPSQTPTAETKTTAESPATDNESPSTDAAPKLGFKPRFKAGVTTTKLPAATEPSTETNPEAKQTPEQESGKADDTDKPATEQEQQAPVTDPAAAKPAYKPRFNPKMVKPKPPQQEE